MTTRSTETQQFDVFLSHNSREKPAVEALAYKLRAEGLNPWLDKEQLIPGTRWQGGLADGLRASFTCAVFIGKDDLGNWESEELDVAQNRAANDRDFRIIPVLLPNLPDPFDLSPLPPFLLSRTWVDFRPGLNDARDTVLVVKQPTHNLGRMGWSHFSGHECVLAFTSFPH